MFKQKILYFLTVILCFSLVSCTKEIEIDIRDFEKKIVVNSLLSTDREFKLHISNTVKQTDTFSIFRDSVRVILYEDMKIVLNEKFYPNNITSSYIPKTGKTYCLMILIDGYDTLYAYDTIPKKNSIIDGVKKPVSMDEYGTQICNISITITDPGNEKNYYEIIFPGAQYDWENEITDPVLLNEGDVGYFPDTYFFSDELFNGTTYTLNIKRQTGFYSATKVILRNISYNYYMYRKYWTRHSYNQKGNDIGIGSLIYMGEPQPMFNNIINGYGIFAGFYQNEPFILRLIED